MGAAPSLRDGHPPRAFRGGGIKTTYGTGIASAAAFLIQTLLSWNAAPPTGATASAPVSMLMPRPPIWDLFGWIDSAISTPRRTPSNSLAVSVVSPRGLPSVTASPSAMPTLAASAGWIITLGAPSRACDDGVSLKEV